MRRSERCAGAWFLSHVRSTLGPGLFRPAERTLAGCEVLYFVGSLRLGEVGSGVREVRFRPFAADFFDADFCRTPALVVFDFFAGALLVFDLVVPSL